MIRIGYPCINHALAPRTLKTFRLASYSQQRFIDSVENNLSYLESAFAYNLDHDIRFFRISSGILPFASHGVLDVAWQEIFKDRLENIGRYIKKHKMRISMHPDQFVLINSPRREVVEASIRDLLWQDQFLTLLGLDKSAKIQIHVGGVYGDRTEAIRSFIRNYFELSAQIKDRLVVENDDKCFPLSDCMRIHEAIGIPVIFDNLHHECLNQGETLFEAIMQASSTWDLGKDGVPMMDYSSQQKGAVRGKHAESLDKEHFIDFLIKADTQDIDLMLEIKDKEKSALKALRILEEHKALV